MTLFADGVQIDSGVTDAAVSAQSLHDPNRFWATPERLVTDRTAEVLEITLTGRRVTNYLTATMAHYPHVLSIECFDYDIGTWVAPAEISGAPAGHALYDSAPAVLASVAAPQADAVYPQHAGDGHWVKVSWRIAPVVTDRWRFILVRTGGVPPRDAATKRDVPYSLALRNVDVGYRVSGAQDIPGGGLLPVPEGTALASTTDYYGSLVEFSVSRRAAERAITDSDNLGWRSEPQPFPYAVVSYYLDVRDSTGTAQTIDRIFVDPLTVGPSLSVYSSVDDRPDIFRASDDPLVAPVAVRNGTGGYGTEGLVLTSSPGNVVVQTLPLGFDATQPWWFAATYRPVFSPATDLGTYPIFDSGSACLQWRNGLLEAHGVHGEMATLALTVPPGGEVRVLLAYLPVATSEFAAGLYAYADVSGTDHQTDVTLPLTGALIGSNVVAIGGLTDGTGYLNGLLHTAVLKQAVLTRDDRNTFLLNTHTYVLRPAPDSGRPDWTGNALVRFHPSALSAALPTGMAGGEGDFFADLIWTPVNRDYVLRTGFLYLPPTRAKFLKCEFTNLAAEHYDVFVPIQRTVRLFPKQVVDAYNAMQGSGEATAGGLPTASSLATMFRYGDGYSVLGGVHYGNQYTPTAAMVAADPGVAAQVKGFGWLWTFQPWHTGQGAPSFLTTGQHRYQEVIVQHTARLGYFAGLKTILPYKINHQADDDTWRYEEHFYDASATASVTGFTADSGSLVTPPGSGLGYAEAVSGTYRSLRDVIGVQFATQQNGATQVAPDQQFREPDWRTYWRAFGDGLVNRRDQGGLLVTRGYTLPAVTPGREIIDRPIETPIRRPPWAGQVLSAGGGVQSGLLTVSLSGRLYAAARVSTAMTLAHPIRLEIVNAADTVLGYAEYTPRPGESAVLVLRLDNPPGTDIGQVRIRVAQYGASADIFSVRVLSLFDLSTVWEFSADDGVSWYGAPDVRGNPHGVVFFPSASNRLRWRVRAYRNGTRVSALAIRPWYSTSISAPSYYGMVSGPNVGLVDHFPEIGADPMWAGWYQVVPRWWYGL